METENLSTNEPYRAYLRRYAEECRKARQGWLPASDCTAAFARHFFPHLCRGPFSRMHIRSFMRYDAQLAADLFCRKGTRLALAAPRGNAKSTVHTLLLPIADICHARERYIVIISATAAQASVRLRNIKAELQHNTRLKKAFGERLTPGKQWSNKSLEVGNVRIDTFGSGSEIRGISFRDCRPTKIILDDVEHSEAVRVAHRRQRLLEWFDEVIENLGDNYTHIEIVGTVLHPRSLLVQLMERATFHHECYSSVIHWSRQTDLWSQWRDILNNLDDETRMKHAREFLSRNRSAMLSGVEVLWKQKENYEQLMIQYTTRGRSAFYKEKQNAPLAAESQPLGTVHWHWFRQIGGTAVRTGVHEKSQILAPDPFGSVEACLPVSCSRSPRSDGEHLSDMTIFGYLDPATGQNRSYQRGDYAAIVTIGRAGDGRIYVLDVWMERATTSTQITQAFQLHVRYGYTVFGCESNGPQASIINDFHRQIGQGDGRVPSRLNVQSVTSRKNKVDRILDLETDIKSGVIVFSEHLPQAFMDQADDFPSGKHDDGLDALAGACALARQSTAKAMEIKAIRRERH